MTDTIFKVPNDVMPWIRESMFRDYFLPAFIEGDEVKCQQWLDEIAVNPFSRVNVVDEQDETVILFWVPALRRSAETQIGGNFNAIIDNIERVKNAYPPKVVKKYIEDNLGGRFVQVDPPEEDVAQWHMIADRYNFSDKGNSDKDKGSNDGHETFVVDDWD